MPRKLGAGLLAAILMSSGALAQGGPYSPEDDLDCAIFVAAAMENVERQGDKEALMGVVAGMTYFIGRYEGRVGGDLKEAMLARYRSMSLEQFTQLGEKCGPRLEGLGQRMQDAGSALTELEESAQGEAGKEPQDGN